MSQPEDDGFLSRWSKRKLDGTPEEEIAVETPFEPPEPEDAFEGKTDEEILAALELPDPDTLKSGDNFKAFMNSAVPTRLRNRALRKLWLSNPVLANLDELVDYGEDYTDAATVVENLQTAYQVGRGFVLPEDDAETSDEQDEKADETEPVVAEDPDPTDQAALAADEDQPEETPQAEVNQTAQAADPVVAPPDPVPEIEPESVPARPRRMRFDFETG